MPDGFRMETPIEANISITPLANKRTAHCEQQAAECALAATTAILPGIREAYLNIERAWLHLAPEIDSSRSFLSASKGACGTCTRIRPVERRNGGCSAERLITTDEPCTGSYA
jgi:hypothetical protein